MPSTPFDELQRLASETGVEPALDFLEHHFRRDKEYFKLFEVLKMRCRHRLNLPLVYSQQPDPLDEIQQRELEDSLLGACREIGILFFKSGQFQEGWMYLQPIGDKELTEKLIQSIEPDEENMDSLIEIAVSQGAAPTHGFQLLLKHYGTCNGITTFDTQALRFDKPTQKQMASTLLNHLYSELTENVRYAVESSGQGGDELKQNVRLAEWLAMFPSITEGGAHHVDTTHLASVMRIARIVDEPNDLQRATELAEYGKRLDKDFQYPGNPPFENTYPDHAFYYDALIGKEIDAAIEHFEEKVRSLDAHEIGPVAQETLVDLLVRIHRNEDALTIVTEQLLGKFESLGIAPQPFEIANTPELRNRLKDYYLSQEDLLGFAVSILDNRD
ncbi:MAG: hypothetical protein ACI87E_001566 [Mariniblastus sp.]|jgi:hypothetical protein